MIIIGRSKKIHIYYFVISFCLARKNAFYSFMIIISDLYFYSYKKLEYVLFFFLHFI